MTSKIESQIKSVMNQISDKSWFSNDIEDDNFQLKAILQYYPNLNRKKILDIGCGRGRFVKQLVKTGAQVTGVDISDKLIADAKLNVPTAKFIQASATKLPFKNESFDYVYSIETFEHIPDTQKAIAEACRVLKKGGKIIIIDKNFYSIHPNFFIPTFLRKPILEMQNKWVYKKDFVFKEKYFTKKSLDKYLALYCNRKFTHFLPGFRLGPKILKLKEKFPLLVGIKVAVTNTVYKVLPFTSLYIAWKWIK